MTVEELIKELQAYDPEDIVTCSVDCDSDDFEVCGPDFPRRVFGANCRGVNPSNTIHDHTEAVILFDLRECTFKGNVDIRKEADHD